MISIERKAPGRPQRRKKRGGEGLLMPAIDIRSPSQQPQNPEGKGYALPANASSTAIREVLR